MLVTHDIRTARKVSDYRGWIWKARSCTTARPRSVATEDPFVRSSWRRLAGRWEWTSAYQATSPARHRTVVATLLGLVVC